MRQECLVFAKKLAGTEAGHLLWTAEEHEAWRTVAQVQATRAMFTTDSAGGYLSPLMINPAIRISSNRSVNPLRQIAKVVQYDQRQLERRHKRRRYGGMVERIQRSRRRVTDPGAAQHSGLQGVCVCTFLLWKSRATQ